MSEPKSYTADEAVKMLRDMKVAIDEQLPEVQKGLREEREMRTEFNKRMDTLQTALEDIKRQKSIEWDDPEDFDERAARQRGGLFGGQMKLKYENAITLPASHPVVRERDRDQLVELQMQHDAILMRYWALSKNPNVTAYGQQRVMELLTATDDFKCYERSMKRAGYVRANEVMHPGSGGIGASLNFTLLSGQLFEKVRIATGISDEFIQLPLPRPQTNFPFLASDAMAVLGGVAAVPIPPTDIFTVIMPPAAAFTNPTFSQISFDVRHLLGFLLWNDDMFEDSVVPWLPLMTDQLARQLARGKDTATINGVRSGTTHTDDDVAALATSDVRKAWHGLRKLTNTNKITASAGVLTATLLRTLRASMLQWGLNPTDLFFLVHVGGFYELLKTTDVLTVEKFGPQAVVKTGTLARLDNVDIRLSEFIRTDLNATGKYDASTTTRTIALCVNRTRFIEATYGAPQVEDTRLATQLSTVAQVDQRCDFKSIEAPTAASSTEFAAGVLPANQLYNVLA